MTTAEEWVRRAERAFALANDVASSAAHCAHQEHLGHEGRLARVQMQAAIAQTYVEMAACAMQCAQAQAAISAHGGRGPVANGDHQ